MTFPIITNQRIILYNLIVINIILSSKGKQLNESKIKKIDTRLFPFQNGAKNCTMLYHFFFARKDAYNWNVTKCEIKCDTMFGF